MFTRLAKLIFALTGWKVEGDPLQAPKSVLAVAYHTSNWDAWPAFGSNLALNAQVKWIGKSSIFWWPLGTLLRSIGGVPLKREDSKNFVAKMVEEFARHERFVLAIAPEGTRKRAARWRTGFYYIALAAKVPLIPTALDYKNKRIVFGQLFYPTGDYTADMRLLREFYRPFEPKNPQWADRDFIIDSPAK